MLDILKFFPRGIANEINKEISKIEELVQEIRIRVGNKIIIKTNKKDDIIINYFVTQEEILEIMQIICNNSIYSYQNEIANGYITIKGGHRVGVTGDVVLENNKVINIKYISSLNFRIAKQILDCSNNILKYVINLEENTVFHKFLQ